MTAPTSGAPLLQVTGLEKHFPVTGGLFQRTTGHVHAVDGVSFDLRRGQTLGLVGESGCGKSTLGRCVVRLLEPTGGGVRFRGRDISGVRGRELRKLRADMQMVFQDPHSSLNPRMTVRQTLSEPLRIHGWPRRRVAGRVASMLDVVGLSPSAADRFPHEFSGGQRQRIGIARALVLNPELIVLDEPTSALDVSVQAQVLNLLERIQDEFDLTYLFISHDLSVVRHVADEVAVMYLGQLVEHGPADAVFGSPQHPYTQALLSAIPKPDPDERAERIVLPGDVPSPREPPAACRFHPRCPRARAKCAKLEPSLSRKASGALAACHYPGPPEGYPDGRTLPLDERALAVPRADDVRHRRSPDRAVGRDRDVGEPDERAPGPP